MPYMVIGQKGDVVLWILIYLCLCHGIVYGMRSNIHDNFSTSAMEVLTSEKNVRWMLTLRMDLWNHFLENRFKVFWEICHWHIPLSIFLPCTEEDDLEKELNQIDETLTNLNEISTNVSKLAEIKQIPRVVEFSEIYCVSQTYFF